MKTFKDFLTEAQTAVIELQPAKNDQEIYDRLAKLKKAGIDAQSGSRNVKTDIIVNSRDAAKAKSILAETVNEAPRTASVEFHKQNLDIPVGSIGVNVDGAPNKNITIIGSGVVVIKESGKVYISYYNQFDNEVSEVRLDSKTAAQLKKAL